MTLPSPPNAPVFPAGYGPLPTDFNNWIQTPLSFLTNKIVLRASQIGSQSYTAGTTSGPSTIVQYDTITEDPYGGWNASVNNAWTAPFHGWYEITVFNTIASANSVLRTGCLISGGKQQFTPSVHQCDPGFFGAGCAVFTVWLIGGTDYVQGQCIVTGASTTNAPTAIGRYPRMEISFVSR